MPDRWPEPSPESGSPRVVEGTDHVFGGKALADLVALDPFPGGWQNRQCLRNIGGTVLGGQLAAHCLVAAAMEQTGFAPNSLQLLFIGAPAADRAWQVESEVLRTGRRFAHRRVRLRQGAQTLVEALVMLESGEAAPAGPAPAYDPHCLRVPGPDASTPRAPTSRSSDPLTSAMNRAHPFIDIRGTPGYIPGECQLDDRRAFYWFRIPDSAGLPALDHYALLTLVTDYWYTLPVHGIGLGPRPSYMTTSLDHVVRFHNAPDVSKWILVETECALVSGSIGHKQARFWSEDGLPLATVVQQALIRSAPVIRA